MRKILVMSLLWTLIAMACNEDDQLIEPDGKDYVVYAEVVKSDGTVGITSRPAIVRDMKPDEEFEVEFDIEDVQESSHIRIMVSTEGQPYAERFVVFTHHLATHYKFTVAP